MGTASLKTHQFPLVGSACHSTSCWRHGDTGSSLQCLFNISYFSIFSVFRAYYYNAYFHITNIGFSSDSSWGFLLNALFWFPLPHTVYPCQDPLFPCVQSRLPCEIVSGDRPLQGSSVDCYKSYLTEWGILCMLTGQNKNQINVWNSYICLRLGIFSCTSLASFRCSFKSSAIGFLVLKRAHSTYYFKIIGF